MPRSTDLGTLGSGTLPSATVEDNSFAVPNRDVVPLSSHIRDPNKAHMASAIGVADAAGLFTATNVEGALEEIASGTAANRSNGLIAGGTFNESFPFTGTELSLVSETVISIGGSLVPLSSTVDFTSEPADDYYIVYDVSTGNVIATTTLPEIETSSGIENVLFARITWDGTSTLSDYKDARFFVRNLDRKITYSVTEGENRDAWSEGCFATLEAAFFWLGNYTSEQKATLTIRGTHHLSGMLEIPRGNLILVGDGSAVIRKGVSFSGPSFLRISTATVTENVQIKDLTFFASSSVKAITVSGSADLTGLRIENCQFLGSTPFDSCVYSSLSGAPNGLVRAVLRDCYGLFSSRGVFVDTFQDLTLQNCSWEGPGTVGEAISLMNGGGLHLQGGHITQCETGVYAETINASRIKDLRIDSVVTGLNVCVSSENVEISGCNIETDSINGFNGILVDATDGIAISDCNISTTRTLFGGTAPIGISINPNGVSSAYNSILGCSISGFYDRTIGSNLGFGIRIGENINAVVSGNTLRGNTLSVYQGKGVQLQNNTIYASGACQNRPLIEILLASTYTSVIGNLIFCEGTSPGGVLVSPGMGYSSFKVSLEGNIISTPNDMTPANAYGISLLGNVSLFVLSGNSVDGGRDALAPTATGILLSGYSGEVPHNGVISCNNITRCYDGVIAKGFDYATSNSQVTGLVVNGNNVIYCAHDLASTGTTFAALGTKGFGFEFCTNILVEGNSVDSLGLVPKDAGGFVTFAQNLYLKGFLLRNCQRVQLSGNNFSNGYSGASGTVEGIYAYIVDVAAQEFSFRNSQITFRDNQNNTSGIHVLVASASSSCNVQSVQIQENSIRGPDSSGFYLSHSVLVETLSGYTSGVFLRDIHVAGNSLHNFRTGVEIKQTSQGSPSEIQQYRIVGNTLVSNQVHSPSSLSSAIILSDVIFVSTSTTWGQGVVASNSIEATSVYIGLAINPTGTGDYTNENLIVDQNTVTGNPSGFHLNLQATYNAANLSGLALTGNQMAGANFDLSKYAVTGISLRGNTFTEAVEFNGVNPPGTTRAFENVHIENNSFLTLSFSLEARRFVDVAVDNNKFQLTDTVIGIQLESSDATKSFAGFERCSLSGNTITMDQTSMFPIAPRGIYVLVGSGSTADLTVTDFRIDGNTVESLTNTTQYLSGIKVNLSPNAQCDVKGLSLSENVLLGNATAHALSLDLSPGSTASLYDISVDGNHILPDTQQRASANGISVTGPDTLAQAYLLRNWSVSDNKVQTKIPNSGSGKAIEVTFSHDQATPYKVQCLSLDANEIFVTSSSPTYQSGLELELTCSVESLSVSNNKIACSLLAENDYGLRIFQAFSPGSCYHESNGNYVVGEVVSDGSQTYYLDSFTTPGTLEAVRSPTWVSLNISNNAIDFPAGGDPGMGLPDDQRGSLSFTHYRDVAGGAVILPVYGFVLASNVLRGRGSNGSNLQYGLRWNAAEVTAAWDSPLGLSPATSSVYMQEGWSVTGNSSTNFCSLAVGPIYYGLCVKSLEAQIVSGASVGNVSQDNGSASGWDEILFTVNNNLNANPRA